MSNSRLNYLEKDNAVTEILSALFKTFDDKLYTIQGWGHKTLGYGIKQNKFDDKEFPNKKSRITERTFKHHKKELLERRFIKIFDKTNRVKNGPYYSITPIGMFYLMTRLKSFPKNLSKKLLRMLEFYVTQSNPKFDNSFFDYFNKKSIKVAIEELIKQVVFKELQDRKNLIRFEVGFNENISVRFLEISYDKDTISLHWATMVTKDYQKSESNNIDEDEFNLQIADTINLILSYNLFNKLKNPKEIQKTPFVLQNNLWLAMIHIHKELNDAKKMLDSKFADSYNTSDTFKVYETIHKKHPKKTAKRA